MFSLVIPANAAIIFNVLMQVAAFDPIPAEDTIDKWFALEDTGAFRAKFQMLGFESYFCLSNMGTQAIVFFCVLVLLTTVKLLRCICSSSKRMKRFKRKLDSYFLYRFFLRLMQELYIIFITTAVINLYYLKWETNGQRLNSLVGLALTVIVVL